MQINVESFKFLYGFTKEDAKEDLLPAYYFNKKTNQEINSIKNPLLVKTVFQLRLLINELLSRFGKIDNVKAELSADLKLNKYQRYLQKIDIKRREKLNLKYIGNLREWAININPLNLIKLEL